MSENLISRAATGLGLASNVPSDNALFAAVGRFVIQYALAEGCVHALARKLSGLSDKKARIIFGGMRVSDLTGRMRQLLLLQDASGKRMADVTDCLDQIDAIATKRHNLVHRGGHYIKGVMEVSNWLTAKSVATAEFEEYTEDMLGAMEIDCAVIAARLFYITHPSRGKGKPKSYLKFLYEPWRHKPRAPKNEKKRLQKARKARQPAPQSSQA